MKNANIIFRTKNTEREREPAIAIASMVSLNCYLETQAIYNIYFRTKKNLNK